MEKIVEAGGEIRVIGDLRGELGSDVSAVRHETPTLREARPG
jgi:hypothetical protein